MNILIVADIVTRSGVGNYIKSISYEFAKNGHKVVVASPINDLNLGKDDGVEFKKLVKINKNPFLWLKNISILSKIIKRYKIQVIHANHRMVSFIVSLYNKFHHNVPTVWTAHTVPYPMNFIKRIFAYYGDRSVAISSEAKNFMINSLKIEEERIDLILNGVNEKDLTPLTLSERQNLFCKYNIPQQKLIVCMHGRIDAVKGIDLVVEAVNLLTSEERSKFVVVLSGSTENNPYYDKIKTRIDELKLNDNFIFMGWVTPREILGISDLMIAPSRREGFPLSAIEAFFMKVPVARTRVGGFIDMRHICVGLDGEDIEGIASVLKEYVFNPAKYAGLTFKAVQFANENFTIEKMTQSLMITYEKAIADKR